MPNFKKNKSAFMMKGKSPLMKALIGNQDKLPIELQKEIMAAKYVIIGTDEVENIDFSQVMQDSVRTLRLSEDGEYTFVKFKGDTPSFLDGKTQYTEEEILAILDDQSGIWFISEAEENTWKDNARTVLSRLNPFSWF